MEKELLYTVQREFKRKGGHVQLIHSSEMSKPFICTLKLPGKSEESSFLLVTDNFRTAHKQFDKFVVQLKNA